MFDFRRLLALATVAAVAVTTGVGTAAAAAPRATGTSAPRAVENSPWAEADIADAAATRSNRTEHVLSQATLSSVHLLRNIVPPHSAGSACSPGVKSAPVLVGNRVYGVFNSQLAAYDAAAGEPLWRGPADPSGTTDYGSVAVSGSLLVTVSLHCGSESAGGSVVAFDANTGKPVWQAFGDAPVQSAVVEGDTVVASEVTFEGGAVVGTIQAFDLATGHSLWASQPTDCTENAIVVGGLVDFQACPGSSSEIVASTLRTGRTVWTSSPGTAAGVFAGDQPGPGADHLYVGNPGLGNVIDLNPATGAVQGQLAGAEYVFAVAGTRVFTRCRYARVCAYVQSTHRLSWSTKDRPIEFPVAANGLLFLADGRVLNAYTGKLLRTLFTRTVYKIAVGDGRIAKVGVGRYQLLQLFGLAGY